MFRITKVQLIAKERGDGRVRVFLFPKGENVLEDLTRRNARPYDAWRTMLPDALKRAGLEPAYAATAAWSQRAGCTCGCSPGFKLTLVGSHDLFVDFKEVGNV